MKTGFGERLLCMAAVSAACCVPLHLCYGRLDTACVPEVLAQYAVPACSYELAESVYTDATFQPPGLVSYTLTCFDPWGRVLLTAMEEGVSAQNVYGVTGRLLQSRTPMLGSGTGTSYFYDRQGRIRRTVADYGVSRTETDYTYNADGTGSSQSVTTLGSGGRITERSLLNAEGQVTAQETPGASDPLSSRVSAFDEYGNRIRVEAVGDGQRQTVEENVYEYDAAGHILSAEHALDGILHQTETNVYRDGRLAESHQEFPQNGSCLDTVYKDVTLR